MAIVATIDIATGRKTFNASTNPPHYTTPFASFPPLILLVVQGALLLAASTYAAPPLHVETTTTEAPVEITTAAEVITTAAPAAVIATTTAPEPVEETITGFTETPEVPRSSGEVTTAAPVATTATPVFTTLASVPAVPETTTTTTTPPPPPPTKPPRLSGKAREALIAHLGNIDLRNTDKLVLTPRQRQAIAEELEYQQLGLQPFTDPTPWQRLSRAEQTAFNEKFLSLPRHLQEYAKTQFTSLPDDRQSHAFQMFLTLDLETLSQVIDNELQREREAAEAARIAQEQAAEDARRQQLEAQRRQQQRQQLFEQPRAQQQSSSFNTFQQEHSREYTGIVERTSRLETFRQNLRFIHSTNRAGRGYQLASNHLILFVSQLGKGNHCENNPAQK